MSAGKNDALWLPEHVEVFSSPLLNLFGSLRQLCRTRQGSASAAFLLYRWEGIPARLQREIMTFGMRCGGWNAGFRFAQYLSGAAEEEVHQQLSRLESLASDEFACLLFDYEPSDTNRALMRAAMAAEKSMSMHIGEPAITPQDAAAFLQDIPAAQRTMVGLLRAYWRTCFADIWEKMAGDMEVLRRRAQEALAEDFSGALAALAPELTLADQALQLQTAQVPLKGMHTLCVFLSVYDAPQLSAAADCVDLVCAAVPRAVNIPDSVPDEILRPLAVLSDGTRLRMFRMLWQAEATTKGIADTLSLSPSTVSMHLKLMREAGLVESSKVKKYVFYHLRRERIEQINKELLTYLNE